TERAPFLRSQRKKSALARAARFVYNNPSSRRRAREGSLGRKVAQRYGRRTLASVGLHTTSLICPRAPSPVVSARPGPFPAGKVKASRGPCPVAAGVPGWVHPAALPRGTSDARSLLPRSRKNRLT